MTQAAPPTVPTLASNATYSGDDFADEFNAWIEAHASGQAGTSRPSWATAGFPWVDTTGGGYTLRVWDGSVSKRVNPFYAPSLTISTTQLQRTSPNENVMSDAFELTPKSATSRLLAQTFVRYQMEILSGADGRGFLILRHFDGTNYLGGSSISIGIDDLGAGGTTSVLAELSMIRLLTPSDRRADNGDWSLRVRGGTIDPDDAQITVSNVTVLLWEFEP